ncbi:hypothetical protein [uncultured Lacinutrix sp.]|uniref:hypothetical protein n=1 Tax=uncultured Lacinutrix sp. TaxID=574032 RepID=UPI00260E4D02|nr:hypothetical protein [uncultured Lacinutrix sp.]
MNYLKLSKPVYLLFSFLFLLVACKTIVPLNDNINPEILVSVIEPNSGSKVIASTDPSISLADFVCPSGTDNAGDSRVSYVTNIVNNTVDFRITASDQGGVKYMFVNILHNQVDNIRILNTSNVTPNIIRNANDVRISVTFDEPKTAQILAFEVSGAGSALVLETATNDFSNNTTSIPTINSNEPRIQILDVSNCNN